MSTNNSSISLSILNVYSTIMMSVNDCNILFDPVGIRPDRFDEIDLILITHEHVDHFDKPLVEKIYAHTKATVVTTGFINSCLKDLTNVVPLKEGDVYQIKGVSIHAEKCKHETNDPLSFIIKTDAGCVFHPSDSDYFPEMADIRRTYHPAMMIYTGCSEKKLQEISAAILPEVIVSNAYPMMEKYDVPGCKVRSLNPSDHFCFSFTS